MKAQDNDLTWRSAVAVLGVGIFVGFAAGASYYTHIELSQGASLENNMRYADLAAISLTAVSVMVTILAVFIAFLAFVGRNQIISEAKRTAHEGVKTFLGEDGKPSAKLHKILMERVDEMFLSDEFRKIMEERIDELKFRREKDWGDEDSEYGDD